MKINWNVLLAMFFCSNVFACEEAAVKYLIRANDLASKMPQVNNQIESGRTYDDEHWINDPKLGNQGGYRYLKHDIAISYARNDCFKEALNIADSIKNLGVKDSAWVQIAIEFAKHDQFDKAMKLIKAIKYPRGGSIARSYVSQEMIRAGKTEEARKVSRGAGLKDNHYYSFFYKHALGLAREGKHKEAIDYVNRRPVENQHAHNAFGDMILIFQEKGDSESAQKIFNLYKNKNIRNEPSDAFAKYFAREGHIEKAQSYLNKIRSDQLKINATLEVARNSEKLSDDFYNDALNIIDKYFSTDGGWTIIPHTAYEIFNLKGQKEAERFISKYFDINDYESTISHTSIIQGLYKDNRFQEIYEFMKNTKSSIKDSAYNKTIVDLHLHKITTIPNIDTFDNHKARFQWIILSAMKADHDPKMILNSILNNFPSEAKKNSFLRSNTLQVLGMYSASKKGMEEADILLNEKGLDPLDLARWYIGISMMNRAKEIESSLLYSVHI